MKQKKMVAQKITGGTQANTENFVELIQLKLRVKV